MRVLVVGLCCLLAMPALARKPDPLDGAQTFLEQTCEAGRTRSLTVTAPLPSRRDAQDLPPSALVVQLGAEPMVAGRSVQPHALLSTVQRQLESSMTPVALVVPGNLAAHDIDPLFNVVEGLNVPTVWVAVAAPDPAPRPPATAMVTEFSQQAYALRANLPPGQARRLAMERVKLHMVLSATPCSGLEDLLRVPVTASTDCPTHVRTILRQARMCRAPWSTWDRTLTGLWLLWTPPDRPAIGWVRLPVGAASDTSVLPSETWSQRLSRLLGEGER